MIRLDEKDIRAIASNRYTKVTRKRFLGITLGSLAILLVLITYLDRLPILIVAPIMLVLCLIVVWQFASFWRGVGREESNLLSEWKNAKSNQ